MGIYDKPVTQGFLVAIESEDKITKDAVENCLESGLEDLGLEWERIDVGPLGNLDVYPEDENRGEDDEKA